MVIMRFGLKNGEFPVYLFSQKINSMFNLKFILFVTGLVILSCRSETTKDYATISGKITNHLGKDGSLRSEDGYRKVIKINKDGTFSDTVHVGGKGKLFAFSDGNEVTTVFLKDGYDLHLVLDTDEFDETIKYTGKGAENNNYLAQKLLLNESLFTSEVFGLEEEDFKGALEKNTDKLFAFLEETKGLDADLIAEEKIEIQDSKANMMETYSEIKATREANAKLNGLPSPPFNNFENYQGGATSLSDLKGKYVYVDVWATWCGPCKAEIPYLKRLEEKYRNKNIAFVSISVDEKEDYDAWRKMIKAKEMGGVQLFADKSWKSDFCQAYHIHSIPRFILIDPAGNVVNADMSRPSEEATVETLDKLLSH